MREAGVDCRWIATIATLRCAAERDTSMLEIRQIPILSDNYIYLVREPQSGAVAVVDPAGVTPVMREAERLGWKITHILNTHHHQDHIGGNYEIKWLTKCQIVGPAVDRRRIP